MWPDALRVCKEYLPNKLDQLRDTKMRQQIRETSYELRELEAKLREAYVSKERHAQMAEKGFISEGTVRSHISNLLSKLRLENRAQAVIYALRNHKIG